jgi:RimJ/RimL family protein N-acetyltransferase
MDLETPRLILRQFRESDIDPWSAMCAEPEVMRYASVSGMPVDREQSMKWLQSMVEHWHLHGYGMWAVEEKSTGKFIGRIGLQLPPGYPGTEVAWMLAPAYWGHGFAAEGARAAIDFGFSHARKARLISLIFPQNERSIRLAERLGERYEGDFYLEGHRLLMYSIHKRH